MDIQEYISSGIIESYALGLTSEEETREVEALAAQYPVIGEEVAAVCAALEVYAQQFAQTPPPGLKSSVMAALGDLLKNTDLHVSGRSQPSFGAAQSEEESSYGKNAIGFEPGKNVSDNNLSPSNRFLYWSIAASILLVCSALANLFLYNRLQKTETLLVQTSTEQLRLAREQEVLQNRFGSVMMTASVVSNPEYKIVNLMSTEPQTDAMVVLYWHPQKGNLYITCNKLPPLPPGKMYQLWAMVDQKPMDAGMFAPKQHAGLLTMKEMPMHANAFAITVEDQQGSTAPTGKMYVMGKV